MNKNQLDAFINKRRTQVPSSEHILMPYLEEIQYLLDHGMRYLDIQEFLKTEKQLSVSLNSIGYFRRKYLAPTNSTSKKHNIPDL
ncbi:Uncharacterised protein [Oligella urethralis]|nr:Uncharacterised protein [Oligella urethralis]